MWMAPIRSGLGDQKKSDYDGSMNDWHAFMEDTKEYYGVDMSVLTKPFSEEQMKYYLQVSSGFYSCFVLIFLNLLITACLLFLFSFFLMPVLFHKFVMDKLMQSLIANSVTLQ
jgi:hypothetical protein